MSPGAAWSLPCPAACKGKRSVTFQGKSCPDTCESNMSRNIATVTFLSKRRTAMTRLQTMSSSNRRGGLVPGAEQVGGLLFRKRTLAAPLPRQSLLSPAGGAFHPVRQGPIQVREKSDRPKVSVLFYDTKCGRCELALAGSQGACVSPSVPSAGRAESDMVLTCSTPQEPSPHFGDILASPSKLDHRNQPPRLAQGGLGVS